MKNQEDIKNIFLDKAFDFGCVAEQAYYHSGYKANDRRNELRLLVDLWIEMTGEDYQQTWVWIDKSYYEGRDQGKKDIKKENRQNRQRITRMNVERDLKTNGFGQ